MGRFTITFNKYNNLLRKFKKLEDKLRRYRVNSLRDMEEINRLRLLLEEHNIKWYKPLTIETIPFKKEKNK
jgi:hypothetical protein